MKTFVPRIEVSWLGTSSGHCEWVVILRRSASHGSASFYGDERNQAMREARAWQKILGWEILEEK